MSQRAAQLLLIGTFLPLCWLAMQAVHESGHVAAAWATGGRVEKVVLHPLTISRTDSIGSRCPLAITWAGPIVGVIVPLLLLGVTRLARWKWTYLVQFFAGTCLVANGAYIGLGSFGRIGDAGDLLRQGSPMWLLWLFGLAAIPLGFWLWNGLGPKFGLGQGRGQVDRRAARASAASLLVVVMLEFLLSASQ